MALLIIVLSFINSESIIVLTTSFLDNGSKSDSILHPPYPPHNGDTLYVGPDGDDSYTRGQAKNYGTPWRTIQKAINESEAGDFIIVKDGIYSGSGSSVIEFSNAGASNNWIILKSENLYGAKIDGQNMTQDYGFIFESTAPYWFIEGFEIYDCSMGGIWFNNNCHDYYCYHNKIHTICKEIVDDTYGRLGILTKKTNRNIVIDGNIIYDIGRLPNPTHEGSWSDNYKHDHGLYLQGYNIKVINNIIYDCGAGWAIKVDGNNFADTGYSHVIVNNTMLSINWFNPQRVGHIRLFKNGDCDYHPRAIIENNIFYDPGNAAITKSESDYFSVIRNNLMTCDTIIWNEYSEVDPIYMEISDNIINSNPEFVSIDNLDFHLQEYSSCVDNAINEYTPEYDFDMCERPQGTGYDIGAYEHYEGSSSFPEEEFPGGESEAYKLNVPQIMNNVLAINYSLPRREYVNISLYDMLGRETTVLVDGVRNSGYYSLFKKVDIAPGTYFILMKTETFTTSKKLIYLSNISVNYNYIPRVTN